LSEFSNPGLAGNPHFKEANDYNGSENYNLAQAMLALAFEQRTASMIALLAAGYGTVKVTGIDYPELGDEIMMRIGGQRV